MRRFLRGHILAALLGAPLAVWACGGDDGDGTTDPPTTGTLQVTVTADGTARQGVDVDLFEPGGTNPIDTETTGSDGRATFSDLEPGGYEIEIEVPDGFVLEDDETRKSATVSAGSTANASFAIVDDFDGPVVEIVASGMSFSEDDVTIEPGTKVRWVTTDGGHTVTPDGHSEWSEGQLSNASSVFEHVFESVGEFPYYCVPHQADGMTGIIRVEAP